MVQMAKRLLNKAKKEGANLYLALLEYRNTGVDNIGSPAQLCMSRRLIAKHCRAVDTISGRVQQSDPAARALAVIAESSKVLDHYPV